MPAALLLAALLATGAQPPPEQPPPPAHATEAPVHDAEAPAAHEPPAGQAGHETAAGEHAAAAGGHAAQPEPGEVLMHHVLDGPAFGFWSKHLMYFVIAAVLVLVLAQLARRSYRKGQPSGLGTLVETFVIFIRDEIAEKNIGHGGARFTPLLCSFFFFILVAALLGLIPFPQVSDGHSSRAPPPRGTCR
jgi:hypothetical protein